MFHKQEGPNIELDKPAPEDRALLGPIFGYQRLGVNRLAACVSRLSVYDYQNLRALVNL